MKKTRRAELLLAGTLANYRQAPADEVKIRAARAESNAAIRLGDVDGIAASLAEDFVVVIGDGTSLTSEQYLEAFGAGFKAEQPLRYERITDLVELSEVAPLAAEHGHWTGSLADGRVFGSGTYMAMWRKSGLGWKLRSELFVSLA